MIIEARAAQVNGSGDPISKKLSLNWAIKTIAF
jgi:hypothetical protein